MNTSGIKHRSPSIKELRELTQTTHSSTTAGLYSKYFARRVSIYITAVLIHTSLSANAVTVLFAIVGMIGAFLFSFGEPYLAIIAVLLLHLSAILDHVDGELARYRKTFSPYGIYIDYMAHIVVYASLYMFFAFGIFAHYSSNLVIAATGFVVLSRVLLDTCFLSYGFVQLRRICVKSHRSDEIHESSICRSVRMSEDIDAGPEEMVNGLISKLLDFIVPYLKLIFGPLNSLNIILFVTVVDIWFSLGFRLQYYTLLLYAILLPIMAIYEIFRVGRGVALKGYLDLTPNPERKIVYSR